MLSRLRESLLQNNRVVPVVLAVLAVLIFAWVIFGLVLGGEDQEQVANQEIVAQSPENGTDPAAPEVENRNADSYAAYEAKDPFRQLVQPAESDTAGTTTGGDTTGNGGDDTGGDGTGGDGTGGNGSGGDGTTGGDTSGGGGGQQGQDSDNDGLSDRRENQLGQDPTNPDTDGDGVRDGADDSNGDGRPDGRTAGRGGGQGGGNAGGGSGGRNGGSGGNDGLFDSGGSLFRGGR